MLLAATPFVKAAVFVRVLSVSGISQKGREEEGRRKKEEEEKGGGGRRKKEEGGGGVSVIYVFAHLCCEDERSHKRSCDAC